jgi:hypothetical protein
LGNFRNMIIGNINIRSNGRSLSDRLGGIEAGGEPWGAAARDW